ncbi:MAG: hypothetical protein QW040_03970 [Candidatus Aenigmatarchaeota archaeon]
MIGLAETIHFDFLIFSLGFMATKLVTRRLPKLGLFIVGGKKKIKIHHAYLGAIAAFFSAITGQAILLNISLGTMFDDILYHLRNWISKIFRKTK